MNHTNRKKIQFTRRRVIINNIDEIRAADLVDMH